MKDTMTIRQQLLSSVAGRAVHAALPPLTAKVLSKIFADSYRVLGLHHLDHRTAA